MGYNGNRMNGRQLSDFAERERKAHWDRHANNKTYEQWEAEQKRPMVFVSVMNGGSLYNG